MDSLEVDPQDRRADAAQNDSVSAAVPPESANMRAIRQAFEAFTQEGVAAGVEALLSCAHDDCVFRPYIAGEKTLHGRDEVRAFFREAVAAGTEMTVRPQTFDDNGDEIVVSGSVRLVRPTGGFAESQIRWIYRFRDGLVAEATWGPRHTS